MLLFLLGMAFGVSIPDTPRLPNCDSVNDEGICSSCESGYYKLWKYCYNHCPTAWENNDSTMCCDEIDPDDIYRVLFDLKFKEITDYSATAVDSFSTPDESAFRDSQNNPIPTQERGFYF